MIIIAQHFKKSSTLSNPELLSSQFLYRVANDLTIVKNNPHFFYRYSYQKRYGGKWFSYEIFLFHLLFHYDSSLKAKPIASATPAAAGGLERVVGCSLKCAEGNALMPSLLIATSVVFWFFPVLHLRSILQILTAVGL